MVINGKTRLVGLIGCPVDHSRSPLLHNYWCEKYQINGVYVPLPVQIGQLESALKGVMAAGFIGVNVTIPHKEEAFSLCEQVSERARHAGSVNVISFREGQIYGDCTDGVGFYENLRAFKGPHSGKCLILGAGGAARAIASYLLEKGFSVFISNRTRERAENLVASLGGGAVLAWEEYPFFLKEMDLLINATSLGMGKEKGTESALEEEIYWKDVFDMLPQKKNLCVAETVYSPLETPLLRMARQENMRSIEGIGMLLYQAREGFSQWFGVRPMIEEDVFSLLKHDLGL